MSTAVGLTSPIRQCRMLYGNGQSISRMSSYPTRKVPTTQAEVPRIFTGAEARRQLDLFIKRKSDRVETTHKWKDVRVIGEHKQSKDDFKTLLLQLGRYMRDLFTAQPTRRFIHGFFLHGTTIELWVFDRSGPYSSGEFDIHEEPEQFIRAVAGYAMMSDEELGLDTFVERNGGDLFITITEDATGKEKRFWLERAPLVVQRAIVCNLPSHQGPGRCSQVLMDIRQAATGGRSPEVGTSERCKRSCKIARLPTHD